MHNSNFRTDPVVMVFSKNAGISCIQSELSFEDMPIMTHATSAFFQTPTRDSSRNFNYTLDSNRGSRYMHVIC